MVFLVENICRGLEKWSLTIKDEPPVQAFQKLIYISTLVFGDASSFLLPWKRVFKVTDSQVFNINILITASIYSLSLSRQCYVV